MKQFQEDDSLRTYETGIMDSLMPFRVANALTMYMYLMNQIFSTIWILVYSQNYEEHAEHL